MDDNSRLNKQTEIWGNISTEVQGNGHRYKELVKKIMKNKVKLAVLRSRSRNNYTFSAPATESPIKKIFS